MDIKVFHLCKKKRYSLKVCQQGIANPAFTYNLGDESSVTFNYDSELTMTFTGNQGYY